MSKVKDKISKNIVRISTGIVFLFALTVVGMTAKFILFYSAVQEVDQSDISQTVSSLDKALFDDVTEIRAQKITDKEKASADIRDPFSPAYVPPPPSEEAEASEESAATDDVEDESIVIPESPSEG